MKWRMQKPCRNCPFTKTRAGIHLWQSLSIQFRRETMLALRNNQHFICHETSTETGNGTNLMCAGAITWQHKRGVSSNLERVMSRIQSLTTGRKHAQPTDQD
jgi:hypothetical protein